MKDPIQGSRSIITLTYKGKPNRVKAVCNVPKGKGKGEAVATTSLIIKPEDYPMYKSIEEVHALAAWQLAVQVAWVVSGDEHDLIPAKLHRVTIHGIGEDICVWIVSSEQTLTAKEILKSAVCK